MFPCLRLSGLRVQPVKAFFLCVVSSEAACGRCHAHCARGADEASAPKQAGLSPERVAPDAPSGVAREGAQ